MNMFKSDIFDIRKVRFRSNIKCFEYFGQPKYQALSFQGRDTKFERILAKKYLTYRKKNY